MAFSDDWEDMCGAAITAQPVALDEYGEFVASGAALALACHIDGQTRLVRDNTTGREVVSSFTVTIPGRNNLTVEGFRYTLPDEWMAPSGMLAISIGRRADEEGIQAEVVMLP
jgi:hypothetical protein